MLEKLRITPEAIEKTEAILQLWGVEALFVRCSYCGRVCYNPDLPKRNHLRKKLPSELWWKRDVLGLRDSLGEVICWPCDEDQFQN